MGLCLSSIEGKELADDIVQITFLQIISHVSTLRRIHDTNRVKAYLNTTVRNLFYNHKKRENRLPTILSFEQLEEAQDSKSLEETVVNKLYTNDIIKSLTEREQDIVTLYYFVELDIKEIAKIVHLSASNVRVILHRIRKKTKQDFVG